MVEIQHADAAPPVGKKSPEDDHYRLVYTKSKVYVHPTAYARDNIPGFVALVKRVRVQRSCTTARLTRTAGSSESHILACLAPRKPIERAGL